MPDRERIEPTEGDSRFIRRYEDGQFTEGQVDVARSLAADRRQKTENVAEKGQGDRGDRER